MWQISMSPIVGRIVRWVCSSRFVAVYGLCHNLTLLALASWMVNYRGRSFDVDSLLYCLIGCGPYLIDAGILHHQARRGSFSIIQAVLTGAILILGLGALVTAFAEVIPIMLGNPPPKMSGAAFVVTTVWLFQLQIAVIAFFASGFSR